MGAESFHGPVRDGKGWVQLAMGVKLKKGHVLACIFIADACWKKFVLWICVQMHVSITAYEGCELSR